MIFDEAGSFKSQVSLPLGAEALDIARAPNGEIFIARTDGTVHRFDASLNLLATWNSGVSAQYGINIDSQGHVYAAGSGSSSVQIRDAAGVSVGTLTPSGTSNLRDVGFLGDEIWVTNFSGNRIDVFDATGSDVADLSAPSTPFGIHRAPDGDVWVVDQNGHEIRRIDQAGNTVLSFDADLGPFGPLGSQLRQFGVDPVSGRVFVPDTFGTRVDVYDGAGVHQFALSDASLSGPGGVIFEVIT